jgi:hypothetical protein
MDYPLSFLYVGLREVIIEREELAVLHKLAIQRLLGVIKPFLRVKDH